jgi:mono/diheme cytochrome c family protein
MKARRIGWALGAAGGGLAVAAAAAAALGFFDSGGQDAPDDPQRIATGRALYAQHCASCHGDRLQGQPNWRERKPDGRLPAPPHDETGHTWHHPDEQLFELTKKGVSGVVPNYQSDMPAFEGVLTDDEIRAVLAFIKSTWSPEIRRRQEARSR